MSKRKKFVATIVTTSLVATAVSPVAAATERFSDVSEKDSHHDNIYGAVERGLIKGYPDGTYKPALDISRGQMAKALARHVVNKDNSTFDDYIQKHDLLNKVKPFTDVQATHSDQELFQAALIVKHAGIFTGSNNNLMPNQSIARQQMAKVLVNAFNLKETSESVSQVTDNNTAQAEFVPYINILSQNRVTNVEQFRPLETVKRSQMASFLIRAYDIEQDENKPEDTILVKATDVNVNRVNGQNIITINYGNEMTDSAKTLSNYKIDNVALSNNAFEGATADFTDATKSVVKITLPPGQVPIEDTMKEIEFSQSIKGQNGDTVQTADKKVLKIKKAFKDDTAPLLNKAEFVVASSTATTSNVLKLTFNENVSVTEANVAGDVIVKVGSATVTGKLTDGKYTDAANNPVLLYVLDDKVSLQSGTVEIIKEGPNNPIMGIVDLYSNKADAKSVVLKDKLIDTDIAGAVETGTEDEGTTIDLELLTNGQLLDGNISLEDLLRNENVLRLKLPVNLALGDVIKLGDLLSLTLTQNDLDSGTTDVKLTTELLKKLLSGDGTLNLTAERDGNVVSSTIHSLNLPEIPVVTPVINLVDSTVEDLLYILSGDRPIKVELPSNEFEKVKAGDTLKLTIEGMTTETVTYTLKEEDIINGYVNYTFKDKNLITRLLDGLTNGSTIKITPEISDGEKTSTGETNEINVNTGLVSGITKLIERLLSGNLGGGLLDGLLDGLLGGNNGGLLSGLLGRR